MLEPNPAWRTVVADLFADCPFLGHCSIALLDCGPGWCEAGIELGPEHRQQNGFVHAGVQSTLADHTAGAAAATLLPAQRIVLTLEFKIHLLRAASGERLLCRAEILKPGRDFSIVESEVFAISGTQRSRVSKAMLTMAYVADKRPLASAG